MKKFYYTNDCNADNSIIVNQEETWLKSNGWIVVEARNYTEATHKLPEFAKSKVKSAVSRYENELYGSQDPVHEMLEMANAKHIGFIFVTPDDIIF